MDSALAYSYLLFNIGKVAFNNSIVIKSLGEIVPDNLISVNNLKYLICSECYEFLEIVQ